MAYMQQSHFQQMWHHDFHVMLRNFLLPLFCIWIPYLSHSDGFGNSEILNCSDVFARGEKLYKPENMFKQTHINFFYSDNMTSFLN